MIFEIPVIRDEGGIENFFGTTKWEKIDAVRSFENMPTVSQIDYPIECLETAPTTNSPSETPTESPTDYSNFKRIFVNQKRATTRDFFMDFASTTFEKSRFGASKSKIVSIFFIHVFGRAHLKLFLEITPEARCRIITYYLSYLKYPIIACF